MRVNRYISAIVLLLLSSLSAAQVQHSYGALDIPNFWTATNAFTVGLFTGPMTFSQITSLAFVSPGTIITCSNCTTGSNPCTVGSSQVIAIYLNSAWTCNSAGGGSEGGTVTSIATTPPITGGTITSTGTIGINNATSGAVGVVQLAGDLSGSASAPTVVNGSHITNSSITNSGLVNTGVTVTAGTGLTGGGTVVLGGTITLNATSSGGGNPSLDNCTTDQSGNSFYNVTSLTNYFLASWSFIFNTTTYINCTIYIPAAQSGATIVLDIAANDSTSGHTANFQTCDAVVNSGSINVGSLTCAANQTFTTTSTAYNRVTLTFNVQSTLSNGSILVMKIATSPTGTAPTANMLVYPHFVL